MVYRKFAVMLQDNSRALYILFEDTGIFSIMLVNYNCSIKNMVEVKIQSIGSLCEELYSYED